MMVRVDAVGDGLGHVVDEQHLQALLRVLQKLRGAVRVQHFLIDEDGLIAGAVGAEGAVAVGILQQLGREVIVGIAGVL